MTYTSNYQSQMPTGSSIYSPFNKSSGQAPPIPQEYGFQAGPAASTPGMAADQFVAPSSPEDIDRISGSIDAKIARIRQAFSQQPQMAPPSSMTPQAPAVSQEDIQWALQLEQAVKGGHQPTAQETAKYENIAQRLQNQQQAPPAQPQPQAPAAPAVSQEDIQWALQLEQAVKGGHQPTAQETAKYENIAQRLQAQQQAPAQPQAPAAAAVSQEEIQWALQLEQKVKSGQQPTAQETAQYEDIAKRLQAQQQGGAPPTATPPGQTNWSNWSKPFAPPQTPTMPQPIASPTGQPILTVPTSLRAPQAPAGAQNVPTSLRAPQANPQFAAAPQQQPQAAPQFQNVSQQEIQWALQLEQMVKNGHQPSPQETAQYNNIAQRMQAGVSQAPQQQPQAPQFAGQQMPPPQALPQAQAPQQQNPTLATAGVSQQEVQWALNLEQQVKGGYQPSPQETAQYNNIAQRLQAGVGQTQPQQQAPQQIVPQNYPYVQPQTPQMVVPPQQQLQQPLYGQTQAPPQQFPAYGTPGTPPPSGTPGMPPGYQMPPGQPMPQQQQAPGFTDRLKNAWNALWG